MDAFRWATFDEVPALCARSMALVFTEKFRWPASSTGCAAPAGATSAQGHGRARAVTLGFP
jgi:hypothetical protein